MATYIEYILDDGSKFLVELREPAGRLVRASRGKEGNVIVKVEKRFSEALESVKSQAVVLRQKLNDLKAEEVEVKFSLKATGEAGNFAIGTVGVEANYEVTLKWKNEKTA